MRTKDILSTITEVCTLVFKVMIFGTVMLTMIALGFHVFVLILNAMVGVFWVLGHKNVMVLYHMFSSKGKE